MEIELERIFKEDSFNVSNKLIKSWKEESIPISRVNISSTHECIYGIYEDIFKSDLFLEELDKLSEIETNNVLLVQDEITFAILDSIPSINNDFDYVGFFDSVKTSVQDTIRNFSPNIDLTNKSILYFNTKYQNILLEFLFNDDNMFDDKWHFIFHNLPIELVSRKNLNPVPYILNIYVNQEFNKALIDYYVVGEGKVALLHHRNSSWELIKIDTVFVE